MSSRLALALDFESREEFFNFSKKFQGLPVVLKIGLRTLPFLTPDDFATLKKQGYSLFIDAKLHDIPTQVEAAVRSWSAMGADFLTIHAGGGAKMISDSVRAATSKTRILGVSVLTSLGQDDLSDLGFAANNVESQVQKFVGLGIKSGLKSFVCSVQEVAKLRTTFPTEELFFCCPGVVRDGELASADQKRSVSLSEALKLKISLIVIGRSVFKSTDPLKSTREILSQMGSL